MTALTLFAQEAPNLNTDFADFTPVWNFGVVVVMLGILFLAWKAVRQGHKEGKPAKLAEYAACAVVVCLIVFVAARTIEISHSPAFDNVGRMAKLTGGNGATTTTR